MRNGQNDDDYKRSMSIKKGSSHEKALKGKKVKQKREPTRGIHQMGLKDTPRHKRLDGSEVKY